MMSGGRNRLYLVDDGPRGWNIREVDLSSGSDLGDSAVPQPLPPAVLKFSGPCGLPHQFTSAFGTMITAILPSSCDPFFRATCIPIYDVSLNEFFFGPSPMADHSDSIYIPVGCSLFSLAAATFMMLRLPPIFYEDAFWQWFHLEKPPFERQHVTSYAVHPDGRTILVSTQSGATAATFAFDTEVCLGWRLVGDWRLPFTGRGYFDSKLDSFVGLSTDPDTLGHLYTCTAISFDDINGGQCQAPRQRLSKERLFDEGLAKEQIDATQEKLLRKEEHLGATLVYMENNFCLVQCIRVKENCADDEKGKGADDNEENGAGEEKSALHLSHFFRLTKFSLKYGANEDLMFDEKWQVQHYEVPEASIPFLKNPVAFYL